MQAILLAAGVGSRLGRPFPKSLVKLPDGETILGRQIRIFKECGITQIFVVVGFKMTLIMENFPNVFYRYNPFYYITNTSKSLLHGMNDLDSDIVWTNADVVFDEQVLQMLVQTPGNGCAVDRKKCGAEEVKYRTDEQGNLTDISKAVVNGHGEAVGLNKISRQDLPLFRECLKECADTDYFEAGMEAMIGKGKTFQAVDISDYRCVEVDFDEDLHQVYSLFAQVD
jgi:choline kinase